MKQLISEASIKQNIFLVSFAGIALKLEKVGPIFSSFNSCPSILAIRYNRREETVSMPKYNIVLKNKTETLFWGFN